MPIAPTSFPDVLTVFGTGGGTGPNNVTMANSSADYKFNCMAMGTDVYGPGYALRVDCIASYSQSTDKWGSFNTSDLDAAVAIADHFGGQLLFSVHAQSPTSTAQVPKITSGVMQSWKAQWATVLSRYCGPNATIKAGSTVKVTWSNGKTTTFTISQNWPGVKYIEIWQEPNQIGSCGGALTYQGSNQSHAGPELVYFINRDAINAAVAHPSWGTFFLSGLTLGGVSVSQNLPPIMAAAEADGGWPTGLHAMSFHCYQHSDPLTTQDTWTPTGLTGTGPVASSSSNGVLDQVRSMHRPQMDAATVGGAANGGRAWNIWITECGNGGSLINSGTEQWNVDHNPYASVTAGQHVTNGDVHWGHKFGDAGASGSELADPDTGGTHYSQPFMERNFIRKAQLLNTQNNAKIEMITRHIFIRTAAPTAADVNDGNGSYLYWQKCRAYAEIPGADTGCILSTGRNVYVPASGTPFRSSSWLPVCGVIYDELQGSNPATAPVNVSVPSVSDQSPDVGEALSCDPGTWSGGGSMTFAYRWHNIDGTTGTDTAIGGADFQGYTVQISDLADQLYCKVTATNSAGSGSAVSATTQAVANSAGGPPVNTALPTLSDANGATSASNPPTQGVQLTTSNGSWSPAATSETYQWQRKSPTGAVTTI